MRRTLRAGAAAAAVVALVLLGAAPASAHAYVVSSSPAAGSTVHRLDRVAITFDEDLLDLGRNAVQVRGPGGRRVESACATVTGATVAVPVAAGRPGAYRVVWRATSADGHLVGGAYTFRYDGPAAAPAPVPSCAPIGRAAAPRTPAASTALAVAIAVSAVALLAVLAVVVLAVIVVRRSDRDGGAEGGGESPP